MKRVSRPVWTLGVAVVVMTAAAPSVIQAQQTQTLPPVIDRSTGSVQRSGAVTGPAPQAALTLDERISRMERLLDNKTLVDMAMRLDTLQTEVQYLRGELESKTHELEGLKQRQRDLYLDVDNRLRAVELAASQAQAAPAPAGDAAALATTTPAVAAAVPAAVAASAPAADPAAERAAYEQAFNSLKEGQYELAITQFQSFLTSYPKGDYTSNAQYWLGEANYVTRRFKEAEQEFLKVLNQFPDSNKASDASLKLGYTYYELANWAAARKTLESVVARFPNTTVARLAESRLEKMRLEGR